MPDSGSEMGIESGMAIASGAGMAKEGVVISKAEKSRIVVYWGEHGYVGLLEGVGYGKSGEGGLRRNGRGEISSWIFML
jgi:hypothetical protein